jgi:cellulose synthase/poly-beta-1,6-N-acetylglucosamine synthase-like glycosyltransferase
MLYVFWISACLLAYTLAGYPLLVWILSRLRPRVRHRADILPTVSLVIAARDEAKTMGEKISNCLELSYPEDRREIIVVSDASEDSTADIVRSFSGRGVKLIEIPERRGKHYAQMKARDNSTGEILIFTDVSVRLKPDALQVMVKNFADASVGSVSSEDKILQQGTGEIGEGGYIRFEMWLRRLESQIGSLVGLSGSFFAARREVCELWHPSQSSDFFVALHTVAKGLRAVVDPFSHGYYGVTRSGRSEIHRKVRTIVHGLDVLFDHLEMLNPFRYGIFSWQLVSHKLFRWLSPFFWIALLLSNALLWNQGLFYQALLIVQTCLVGGGLITLAIQGLSRFKPLRLASFFLLGNAATVIAWLKFCSGEKFVRWEPTRRH